MPTYVELEREACWRAQVVPDALEWLGESLRDHYGESRSNIGSPGDNRHLRGGHRSRRWILESAFCTSRTYTVTHADDLLGDEDWYCAIDIGGLSQAELIAMCQRLDAAVRAGLLEECWEWYGNLGGDLHVDGWNNLENRLASSDTSHLYHLHLTFRRRYANDMSVMRRALAILTGKDNEMPQLYLVKGTLPVYLYDGAGRRHVPDPATLTRVRKALGGLPVVVLESLADLDLIAPAPRPTVDPALAVRLDAILAAAQDDGNVSVTLDPAALTELRAIRADLALLPTPAEIAVAVADEDHRRSAV